MENDSFLYRRVELAYKKEIKGHLYSTVKECTRKCVFALLCREVMGHFGGSSEDALSSSLCSLISKRSLKFVVCPLTGKTNRDPHLREIHTEAGLAEPLPLRVRVTYTTTQSSHQTE